MKNIELTPPKTRADCINGPRPCPWIRFRCHMVWALYDESRGPKLTDDQIYNLIFSLPETCTPDVEDRGSSTLEEIGVILGITRERVRQIEGYKKGGALRRLRVGMRRKYLIDFVSD